MDSLYNSMGNEGCIRQKLNDELFICYAYDGLFTTQFLMPENFDSQNITMDSLRTLTVVNLKSVLDNISIYDAGGTYYFVAGGNYEASLLLFDDIWNSKSLAIKGELIAAVPARDLLAVTGSEDTVGLAKLREFLTTIDSCPYPISDKLFIRRNGTWEIFNETEENQELEVTEPGHFLKSSE